MHYPELMCTFVILTEATCRLFEPRNDDFSRINKLAQWLSHAQITIENLYPLNL